ncbi:MAG: dTMP kinase [Hansschlegelia sp.]
MAGRFITFEGGEGVGKSTQVRRLAVRLRETGAEVVTTREPGGSPRAEVLRSVLLSGAAKPFGPTAETMLIASARADHVDRVIRPALARGAWVLCDRFIDSTRAYQGTLGEVDAGVIAALERVATEGARPGLTVVLDAPAATGINRARARAGEGALADRFEAEDASFHERLREAFVAIARAEPGRCVLVDASGSEEDVAQRVWTAFAARYGEALAPSGAEA